MSDKCPKCGETGHSLSSWDCGTWFDLHDIGIVCLRRQLAAKDGEIARLCEALSAMYHHFCGSGERNMTDAEVMSLARRATQGEQNEHR